MKGPLLESVTMDLTYSLYEKIVLYEICCSLPFCF